VRRTGSVNRAFVPGVCPVYAPARKAQGRARTDRAGRRGNGGAVFGDQRTGDAVVCAGARDVVLDDLDAGDGAGLDRRVKLVDRGLFEPEGLLHAGHATIRAPFGPGTDG
jgi:hypothetical protein